MWIDVLNRKRFLIEHEIKRPVFGPSAFVREWMVWGSYETQEERDAALTRLEKGRDPVSTRYRARDFKPFENRRIAY